MYFYCAYRYAARPITACWKDGCPIIVALRNQVVDFFDVNTGKCIRSFDDQLKEHKTAIWGEQKHLVSTADYVVYAAFADNDIYITKMSDLKKTYEVNLFQDEAEWLTLDSIDHISAMVITDKEVIVCNGKTQELLFVSLSTHKLVRTVDKHKGLTIHQMSFSPKDSSLYYCIDRDVGKLNAKNERKLLFHHPCKISKVLSNDGRMVVTVGEDNILRIWDLFMEPFSPDLSAFTGKVTVHSEAARNALANMTQGLVGDLGNNLNVKAVLSTSDAKNYWSRDASASAHGDVMTVLHHTDNPRYLVVVQHLLSKSISVKWTKCLTIWDVETMQCLRRWFLPEATEGALGTLYAHGMAGGYNVVLQENSIDITYKLLDLITWKTDQLIATTPVKKLWDSKVLHLRQQQCKCLTMDVSKFYLLLHTIQILKI